MNIFSKRASIPGYLLAFLILCSFALSFQGMFKYEKWQSFISIILVLIVGMPHGAIDHILFKNTHNVKASIFNIWYLSLILIYSCCWIYFPGFSFFVFLMISAYHFGQSQFSDLSLEDSKLRPLYAGWGMSIISSMMVYNNEEIQMSLISLEQLGPTIYKPFWLICMISGTLITLYHIIKLSLLKHIDITRVHQELLILVLIHSCFYYLPSIVAFTIYFCVLHAIRVTEEEYLFLKNKKHITTFVQFARLVAPFSVLSVVLMILSAVIIQSYFLPLTPLIFIIFILLSILTLPHSIVMDIFYSSTKEHATSDDG